jgi:hypothetical protein
MLKIDLPGVILTGRAITVFIYGPERDNIFILLISVPDP